MGWHSRCPRPQRGKDSLCRFGAIGCPDPRTTEAHLSLFPRRILRPLLSGRGWKGGAAPRPGSSWTRPPRPGGGGPGRCAWRLSPREGSAGPRQVPPCLSGPDRLHWLGSRLKPAGPPCSAVLRASLTPACHHALQAVLVPILLDWGLVKTDCEAPPSAEFVIG